MVTITWGGAEEECTGSVEDRTRRSRPTHKDAHLSTFLQEKYVFELVYYSTSIKPNTVRRFTTCKETNYPYASQTPTIVQHKQEAKFYSSTMIPTEPQPGELVSTAKQLHKGLHTLYFCHATVRRYSERG